MISPIVNIDTTVKTLIYLTVTIIIIYIVSLLELITIIVLIL